MLSKSFLFVPADKEKMIRKVNNLQADRIILDLEDAVQPVNKQFARELLKECFPIFTKEIVIRINDMTTEEYKKDLRLIQELAGYPSLKGIMLPKADGEGGIECLTERLDIIERTVSRTDNLYVIPLIESALGVKSAYQIASSTERIERLAFGGVDFIKDIDGISTENELELLYARSEIVISSKSAQIDKPIDTVYVNISDHEGLKKSCEHAKSLGYAGKLLLHPSQIEVAEKVFSPSKEELEEAREIIDLMEMNSGQGVFNLNGRMVDRPIIEKAKRLLSEFEMSQE